MKGYVSNIERDTLRNGNFRKVLYTSKHSQLGLMSLKPGEESGFEKIKINNYNALQRSSYGTSNYWFIYTVFFGDKCVYEF